MLVTAGSDRDQIRTQHFQGEVGFVWVVHVQGTTELQTLEGAVVSPERCLLRGDTTARGDTCPTHPVPICIIVIVAEGE